MNECVFCKIVEKKLSSNVVYENSKVLAFLDVEPANRGHVLVIPKNHYQNLLEAPDSVLVEVVKVVKEVSAAVLKATGATDFNFAQSNGEIAGQSVFHLHFHILPRWKDDGLLAGKLNRPPYSYKEGEAKEIMKKIREALSV